MTASALDQTCFANHSELFPAPDVGFELGWDYAHYGAVPPAAHLDPLSPVRQGWEAGRQTFGQRTLASNRFVRKWLQLRLNAWLRGRAFEGTQVNPAFLRQIDVAVCPITREVLTHGTGELSDASVDRVFNGAAYAGGNLAVMSTRANRAKSDYGTDDAMRFARQIELGRLGQIDGLSAEQWARIAVLTSFVTPMPHARAATLPLLVLPPNRLRVLNPVQSLQVMLSLQFIRGGHARRCAALASLMPSADAKQAFNSFMLTLLARRVAAGKVGERCGRAPRRRRHVARSPGAAALAAACLAPDRGRLQADRTHRGRARIGLERNSLAWNGGGHRGLGARIGGVRDRRRRPDADGNGRGAAADIELASCGAARTVATREPRSATEPGDQQ